MKMKDKKILYVEDDLSLIEGSGLPMLPSFQKWKKAGYETRNTIYSINEKALEISLSIYYYSRIMHRICNRKKIRTKFPASSC